MSVQCLLVAQDWGSTSSTFVDGCCWSVWAKYTRTFQHQWRRHIGKESCKVKKGLRLDEPVTTFVRPHRPCDNVYVNFHRIGLAPIFGGAMTSPDEPNAFQHSTPLDSTILYNISPMPMLSFNSQSRSGQISRDQSCSKAGVDALTAALRTAHVRPEPEQLVKGSFAPYVFEPSLFLLSNLAGISDGLIFGRNYENGSPVYDPCLSIYFCVESDRQTNYVVYSTKSSSRPTVDLLFFCRRSQTLACSLGALRETSFFLLQMLEGRGWKILDVQYCFHTAVLVFAISCDRRTPCVRRFCHFWCLQAASHFQDELQSKRSTTFKALRSKVMQIWGLAVGQTSKDAKMPLMLPARCSRCRDLVHILWNQHVTGWSNGLHRELRSRGCVQRHLSITMWWGGKSLLNVSLLADFRSFATSLTSHGQICGQAGNFSKAGATRIGKRGHVVSLVIFNAHLRRFQCPRDIVQAGFAVL